MRCVVSPDQAFKPGKRVRARVVGRRLMDGLAVCTLKSSAVEAGALSYADIAPGSLISGTVDKVEDFGMFVKLAPGIKCVPAPHVSATFCCGPQMHTFCWAVDRILIHADATGTLGSQDRGGCGKKGMSIFLKAVEQCTNS